VLTSEPVELNGRLRRVWWVGPCILPPGVAAMTLGRVVLVGRGVVVNDALYRHELEHVRQYSRHGWSGFLVRYFTEYLRLRRAGNPHAGAYRGISFEVEARAAETEKEA
jgi:hypothetical protein